MTDKPLLDAVIAVTGAGRGYGHAIARALGLAGATVIAVDTDAEAAAGVASELEGLNAQAIPIKGDFSVQLEVNNTFQKMLEIFGAIDGVVHIADGASQTSFQNLGEGEWTELFDTNARSTYLLARSMSRHSRNAWGIIVLPPDSNQQPQTRALRGCLTEFVEGLASKGVRISALVPSRPSGGVEADDGLAQAALSLALPSSGAFSGAVIRVALPEVKSKRPDLPLEAYL